MLLNIVKKNNIIVYKVATNVLNTHVYTTYLVFINKQFVIVRNFCLM